MDAHRYYAPAALAAAYAAWQAGNDVYSALTQLGYGYSVAQGLAEYYSSRFAEPPPLDPSSQSQDAMATTTTSSSARVKRRRGSYGAIPVSRGVKQYVKGCMDRLLEVKTFPFAPSGAITPGTAGAMAGSFPAQIVQGDTDLTRDGNIIHAKKLTVRVFASDTAPFVVRTILFIDRQSNGTTPVPTDVLNSANFLSDYRADTVVGHGGARFTILWDKYWVGNNNIAATTYVTPVVRKVFKMNMPITYIGNAGTAGDISKNNIWFVSIASTATATWQYSASLVYTDN